MSILDKIGGLISKLEASLNKVILSCWNTCSTKLKKSTPKPLALIARKVDATLIAIRFKRDRLTKKIQEKSQNLLTKTKNIIIPKAIELSKECIHYLNYNNLLKLKTRLSLATKKKIRNTLTAIKNSILKHPIITLLIIALSIGSSTLWYLEWEKISKIKRAKRELAMYRELTTLPDYHHKELKTTMLIRIELPVYEEHRFNSKTVQIEFVVETSNQVVMLYIKNFQYAVIDHVITNLAPMIHTLPYDDEGKKVIADKLRTEIDIFLEKKQVRGHIDQVYIDKMIEL
ncbi:MAG: flagellar basal body-associated FliL family protein [Oligoflexia bacterium]|nr:flagellar basal body-associated FliL family protein [Oligoflexia bacterium]